MKEEKNRKQKDTNDTSGRCNEGENVVKTQKRRR
jgi:hypothetical protein